MTPRARGRGFFRHGFKPNRKCQNCGRDDVPITKHHLIGRKFSNAQVELCEDCHRQLHKTQDWQQQGYEKVES
jgi:hypothetical protein